MGTSRKLGVNTRFWIDTGLRFYAILWRLVIYQPDYQVTVIFNFGLGSVPRGTQINIPVGQQYLYIADLTTSCVDTVFVDVTCDTCAVYSGSDIILTTDCDNPAEVCLAIQP